MAKNDLLHPELLRKLLDYNPETGALTWRFRDIDLFNEGKRSRMHIAKHWNTKHAGKPALTITVRGYKVGSIFNQRIYAHRVIWAIMTGTWPVGDIDHTNGIRDDNRWNNLRDVPHSINLRNRKQGSNNTSGINGVHWHAQRGKWNARVKVNGKTKSLGLFVNLAEAADARRATEAQLGFTERHGKAR